MAQMRICQMGLLPITIHTKIAYNIVNYASSSVGRTSSLHYYYLAFVVLTYY
jgi:hypothetical protein